METNVACRSIECRPHAVGTLVDDAEAEIFEQRHTVAERDRLAQAIERDAEPARLATVVGIEVDADGLRVRQRLDAGDVLQRPLRPESLAVAGREGVPVLGDERHRLPGMGHADDLRQAILPALHDQSDALLERGAIRARCRSLVTADDEVNANQRPIQEVRRERRQPALVGLGEERRDTLADLGREAVARHEDERGDEPVELVDTREHAHARAQVEVENLDRPLGEQLDRNLKQLVARIGLDDVEERLAVVTIGRKPRGRDDAHGLLPQERNGRDRSRVGGRREQPDDSDLARHAPIGTEGLGADVVEMSAPMHFRSRVGLRDDQDSRLLVELLNLWRHVHECAAAPQDAYLGVAQNAEPALQLCVELAGSINLPVELANTEEGEVAGLQPLQKGDAFLALRLADREESGSIGLDQVSHAGEHLPPVGNGRAHLHKDRLELANEIGGDGIVDRLEIDLNEALLALLPLLVARPGDRGELARGVAAGLEDRVEHQLHGAVPGQHLAHDEIDQERHVVVEDLDQCRDRGRSANLPIADLVMAGGLVREECRGALGNFSHRRLAQPRHDLLISLLEQQLDEEVQAFALRAVACELGDQGIQHAGNLSQVGETATTTTPWLRIVTMTMQINANTLVRRRRARHCRATGRSNSGDDQ